MSGEPTADKPIAEKRLPVPGHYYLTVFKDAKDEELFHAAVTCLNRKGLIAAYSAQSDEPAAAIYTALHLAGLPPTALG